MRLLPLLLLISCCWQWTSSLKAQEYYVEEQYITVKPGGLSSRRINDIGQSAEGYIWLATDYGLNRYDGDHFVNYTHSVHQLASDKVRWVRATKNNLLWLFYGTPAKNQEEKPTLEIRHIDIFDIQKEQAVPLEEYFSEAPFSPKEIENFSLDENDRLWIWTKTGAIYYFDGELKSYYQSSRPLKIDAVLSLPESNELWYTADRELLRIDAKGEVLAKDSLNFYPLKIVRTEDGTLWMPTARRGPYRPKAEELIFYKNQNGPVTLLESEQIKIYNRTMGRAFCKTEIDRKGRVWNYDRNRLEVIGERRTWRRDLTKKGVGDILCIFFDRNHLAFIGTEDGFYIVNLKPNQFTPFLKDQEASTRGIIDFHPDSFLVFTYGDSYAINKFDGGKRPVPFLRNISGFGAVIDTAGVIWVGNHGTKLYRVDLKNNEFDSFFFDKSEENKLPVLVPFIDQVTGRIWLGARKGLAYLDVGGEYIRWYQPKAAFEEIKDLAVNNFYQNSEGLWLATNRGVYLYREGKGIVEHFEQFPYGSINHIHEDEDGIFWLSTLGGGIIRWDRGPGGGVRQFAAEDGLSNNVIYMAMGDELGNLWLPSNRGLMRMNREDFSVLTYYTTDGLPHDEFNNISACKGREGRLYFGGINGLISFNPARMMTSSSGNDRLLITSLQKSDPETGKMLDALPDFQRKGILELKPQEKTFTLHFTFPYFQSQDQLRYAYRIGDSNAAWSYISTNYIDINGLPYGRSELRLRAQGGNFASSEELIIPIHAKRPIYHSIWFWVAVFLIIVALVLILLRWRLKALKRDKLRLEELVEERTQEIKKKNKELAALNQTKDQFFGIIAHDLRGPMLSFRGLNKKLKYLISTKQEERIEELGQSVDHAYAKLDRLLDNLLNWALVQRGTLPFHPEKIHLTALADEVIGLFTHVAESQGITLENKLPQDFSLEADANACSAILRNLINNAIKFSPAQTTIHIEAILRKDQCQVLVCDEGDGFSPEELKDLFKFKPKRTGSTSNKAKGTGLGLQLCKELMELHGGGIRIESQQGLGTQIYLIFPYAATQNVKTMSNNKQSAS